MTVIGSAAAAAECWPRGTEGVDARLRVSRSRRGFPKGKSAPGGTTLGDPGFHFRRGGGGGALIEPPKPAGGGFGKRAPLSSYHELGRRKKFFEH